MSDFRISYGFALGPFGTVSATSAKNVIPSGDTTPNISGGSYWLTGNEAATTITSFEGRLQGGVNGVEEGKLLFLLFRDNNTTINNSGTIYLAQSGGQTFRTNETLALLHSNSAWYELFRSYNDQSTNLMRAGSIGSYSLAGSANFNVTGVSLAQISATAATTVLVAISGGYEDQRVVLFLNTAGVATRIQNTAGNIYLGATDWTTMTAYAAYEFVKVTSPVNAWYFIGADR